MPALDGLVVLEVSETIAAAYCGQLLRQAGARVVKVEPPGGDPLRREPATSRPGASISGLFVHLHGGKESVELDLDSQGGRDDLVQLARRVDLVVEDLPRRRAMTVGLRPDGIGAAHDRLVLTSISPFGRTGPYRDYAATDLVTFAYGARTLGPRTRPPQRLAPGATEYLGGAMAAFASLAAVRAAQRDGVPDYVDIALVECLLAAPDRGVLYWDYAHQLQSRPPGPAPLTVFPCADGWVNVSFARGIAPIARLLGRPELVGDPRFATRRSTQEHADALEGLVTAWTMQRTRAEILAEAHDARVVAGPIWDAWEVQRDPQLRARGAFTTVDQPNGGRVPGVGPVVRVEDDPWLPPAPAPALDAHRALPRPSIPRAVSRATGDPGRPLEGVRVIDLGDAWAGPYCCTLLADAGADVIKIEDIHRMPPNLRGPQVPVSTYPGYVDSEPGARPWERFFLYHHCERNKRGVTLTLSSREGQDLARRLIATADVVVSNLTPGILTRFGLDPHACRALRPDLLFLRVTGYGMTGPYRDYLALGATIDGATSHQWLRGDPAALPDESGHIYFADAVGAYTGAYAVMAALRRRDRTGRGALIDLALTETLLPYVGGALAEAAQAGGPPQRRGNSDPAAAPQGFYRCAGDDAWVAIAVRSDAEWAALTREIGAPTWAADPRFHGAAAREEQHDRIRERLEAWTRRRPPLEAMHRLQHLGIPAAADLTDADAYADPHLRARDFLQQLPHPAAGVHRYPAPPWQTRRFGRRIRRTANLLGEHNEEVLGGELGLSAAEMDRLRREGVIGEEFPVLADRLRRES